MAEKTNPQKNISVQNFLFSQKNIFFALTKKGKMIIRQNNIWWWWRSLLLNREEG